MNVYNYGNWIELRVGPKSMWFEGKSGIPPGITDRLISDGISYDLYFTYNGKHHRMDGPAVTFGYTISYFLFGWYITSNELEFRRVVRYFSASNDPGNFIFNVHRSGWCWDESTFYISSANRCLRIKLEHFQEKIKFKIGNIHHKNGKLIISPLPRSIFKPKKYTFNSLKKTFSVVGEDEC